MTDTKITIPTEDGLADGHFIRPAGDDSWPAIIFFMDGGGIRPELLAMAKRLAASGYAVLAPNLYYRAGPTRPIDNAKFFTDPEEQAYLGSLMKTTSPSLAMRDMQGWFDFLARQDSVKGTKVGCVGYCLGGGYAVTLAGTFPERVAAAASIHGASLATEIPDSPHTLAGRITAELYVAVAGIDPWMQPGETERLEAALAAAGTRATVELYPDVQHGFAVDDNPAFDQAAAEHHWERLLALYARTL